MSKSKKISTDLLFVAVISALLRYIPSLYTNMPFSNDSWPLINMANYLISYPNTRILDLEELYGHHAHWPLSVIYSVMTSLLCGISIIDFHRFMGGFITGISISTLSYIVGRRLFRHNKYALGFSLGFTLFSSYTIYTSAFLKETFGYIIVLIILYLLHKGSRRDILDLSVIAVLSFSLILSHLLPVIIVFASIVLIYIDNKIGCRFRHTLCKNNTSSRFILIYSLSSLLVCLIYNILMVRRAMLILSINDVIIFLFYSVGLYSLLLLLQSTIKLVAITLLTLAVLTAILSQSSIELDPYVLLYVVQFPVLLITRGKSKVNQGDVDLLTPFSVSYVVSTIVLYIATWYTMGLGLIHRFLNYLVFPFSYIHAIVMSRKRGYIVSMFIFVTVIIALINASCCPGQFLFYWRYTHRDSQLHSYISYLQEPGVMIYGDVKYYYMLGKNVNEVSINSLSKPCSWLANGSILISNRDDFKYGYPISPIDHLKINEDIVRCSNLIYNDLYTFMSGS